MTTRVSNNGEAAAQNKKYSPVLHNWRCNVRSNRKIQIVLTILHMVAAPAVLLAAIISIYSNNELDSAEPYAVIGVISTCIAAFLGIFVAVDSFKCLYKRSVVDMRLSLPLTADQRFVSNFLSGLFTYMAPFLAAQVLSLLLAGYGLIFMDGRTFYSLTYTYTNAGDRITKLVPYICDSFSYIMPALLKLILCGTLAMLMLYTMAVLVTVCCGSKFESIAYAIIINAVIPLTILMVTFSMFSDIFGIYPESTALRLFLFTSPAGGIFTAVGWVDDDFLYDLVNPAIWAIVYFLVTAAIGVLAFFLYRKRRAEQVSKPFVFKLLYYIILTSGIFCLFSAFYMVEISIIPTIITTAIIYMIFEVVTNRGFKKFWLSGIKYAVTMVSAFLLIFTAHKTDGFGALWKVPSANMVSSVEINYDGFYTDFNFINTVDPVILTDRENIEAVIAAHKSILDEYREYQSIDDNIYNYYDYKGMHIRGELKIIYRLVGGGTIERNYDYCVTPKAMEYLSVIDLSDEYKTQTAEKCKNTIMNIKTEFKERVEYQKSKNRSDYLSDTAYLKLYLHMDLDNDPNTISMYYLCNHNFFEQLAEAYSNDIMAINEENYYRSEIPELYTLYFRYGNYLNIPGSFENTLRVLSEYDFYILKNEDVSDEEIYMYLIGSSVTLFSEDEYRKLAGVDENDVLHSRYGVYSNVSRKCREESYYIYDLNKELFDIIRRARPRNIVGENCYTINVSGVSFVIPAEMQPAAERAAAGRTPYNEVKERQNAETLDQLRQGVYGVSTYSSIDPEFV